MFDLISPMYSIRPIRLIRLFSGLLPLLLLGLLPLHAGHEPQTKIFFRVYIQTSGGPDMPSTQVTTIPLPPNNETIQVRAMPEITEREIIDVKVDTQNYVHIFLDHTGQVNLSATTGANEGRILVVMINGFIVYAPVIDQQITSGQLTIPHSLKPDAIKLLQEVAADNLREAKR